MKNATKSIIVIVMVVGSFIGIWFFGGLYSNDSENISSYEIERAIPVGVSQSYSPDIICETDEFRIKRLTPELFSIFAKEKTYFYDYFGYMRAINNAIVEIGCNNEIKSITAITSHYSQGSATRHLLVIVSPRNASASYNHSGNNS